MLYEQVNNTWIFRAQTEIMKRNLNPNFETGLIIPFYFEKAQRLKFVLLDANRRDGDNEIGSIETTVSTLMGSKA